MSICLWKCRFSKVPHGVWHASLCRFCRATYFQSKMYKKLVPGRKGQRTVLKERAFQQCTATLGLVFVRRSSFNHKWEFSVLCISCGVHTVCRAFAYRSRYICICVHYVVRNCDLRTCANGCPGVGTQSIIRSPRTITFTEAAVSLVVIVPLLGDRSQPTNDSTSCHVTTLNTWSPSFMGVYICNI